MAGRPVRRCRNPSRRRTPAVRRAAAPDRGHVVSRRSPNSSSSPPFSLITSKSSAKSRNSRSRPQTKGKALARASARSSNKRAVLGEESFIRPGNSNPAGPIQPHRLPQTKPWRGHLCTSPPHRASANRAVAGRAERRERCKSSYVGAPSGAPCCAGRDKSELVGGGLGEIDDASSRRTGRGR